MVKRTINTVLSLAGAFCLVLALGSCKEKGVIVKMSEDPIASDTTYMAPVESLQPRKILIEEFTGVSCPPCPLGHRALASLLTQYPGRLAVIGIQVFGFIQANPVMHNGDSVTKHDNRTAAGTEMSVEIFGKLSKSPVSGIDRFVRDTRNNSLYIERGYWGQEIATRLSAATKANVTVSSDYNESTKKAVITVRVAYTSAMAKKQKLTIAMVENKVIDAQEDGEDIIEEYEHEHVLRDILTATTGSSILGGVTIEAGRVYERTIVYDMSEKTLWNPANCKIVAFVSNDEPGDLEVHQAAEINLK